MPTPNRGYPLLTGSDFVSTGDEVVSLLATKVDTDIAAILTDVAAKAGISHTHTTAQVAGLDAALAAKMSTSATFSFDWLNNVSGADAAIDGQVLVKTSNGWSPASAISVLGAHQHAFGDIVGLSTALSGKEPNIAAGTAAQYWRGDKTWQTHDKTSVGLSNADNTSDVAKPVSTATNAALALKADLSGATFTGFVIHKAAGQGGVSLNGSGTSTETGIITFLDAANVRCGYIGYSAAGGYIKYAAENGRIGHEFYGTVSMNGGGLIAGSTVHHDGNASRGAPDWVLEDQKASGTAGGTSVVGWTTRTLNTEVRDPLGLVSLSANQFTSTVDGWIEWTTETHQPNGAKTRLWNVTDNVLVANGPSLYGANSQFASRTCYGGSAVTAGKTYRIEQYIQTAVATQGLGVAGNVGTEVYARVLFWRS